LEEVIVPPPQNDEHRPVPEPAHIEGKGFVSGIPYNLQPIPPLPMPDATPVSLRYESKEVVEKETRENGQVWSVKERHRLSEHGIP
jgi:hypothetical protein